jgi:para-nitrobenzyl esterase
VQGIPAADPRVTAFKGIPFAAPAGGENRWRAPQPVKPWEGVRNCSEFGSIAMQEIPGGNPDDIYTREWHVDGSVPMSEDCLQLNIWTNAKSADEKLPVLIWIYGGGLMVGYPSEMEMDGERIARRGVILVSINYRVNVFGFLAHPALTAEATDAPTNFGHLDQQAGIRWVKRNIAAFGGDPDNITIFGQSAGGGSCEIQLCSPQNSGLFQRAILHSGGGLLPPSSLSLRLAEAEKQGERFFEALGVTTLEEARRVDAQTVWDTAVASGAFAWGTVIGDPFLPDTPANIIGRGEENDAELVIGNTGDEFLFSPGVDSEEALEEYAHRKFPGCADEYLAIVRKGAKSLDDMKKNATYNNFEMGNMLLLDLNAARPKHTMYFYRFDPLIPGWDDPGAFHSSDLWFAFETLAKCWRPFTGKHYDLARQMCNYWTNFARSGNPNGDDADGTPMEKWEPYTADNRKVMFFGDRPELQAVEQSEFFRFLQQGCESGRIPFRTLNGFDAEKEFR